MCNNVRNTVQWKRTQTHTETVSKEWQLLHEQSLTSYMTHINDQKPPTWHKRTIQHCRVTRRKAELSVYSYYKASLTVWHCDGRQCRCWDRGGRVTCLSSWRTTVVGNHVSSSSSLEWHRSLSVTLQTPEPQFTQTQSHNTSVQFNLFSSSQRKSQWKTSMKRGVLSPAQNWLQLMDGERRWVRWQWVPDNWSCDEEAPPSEHSCSGSWNEQITALSHIMLAASKWRLLCQPHSPPDQECITKVCKNRWMDGWLGFNGILSMQVSAISCVKRFKVC